MNTEAVNSAVPAGEVASLQRVRQLQVLIEAAGEMAVGGTIPQAAGGTPSSSFSAALAAATSAAGAPTSAAGAPTSASAADVAGAGSGEYESLIAQAAERYGVDPAVLHGLIQQESGFDPDAQSAAGAAGLTQLMPSTASSLGVSDPLNPGESIEGGARYLAEMMERFGGNTNDALAAYNAGPGAVEQYGGVPPYAETQSYVGKVLGYAESYRQTHLSAVPA